MDEPSGKYFDFMAMFKDVQKDLFTEYRIYFGTARRRIVMMGIAVPCLQYHMQRLSRDIHTCLSQDSTLFKSSVMVFKNSVFQFQN